MSYEQISTVICFTIMKSTDLLKIFRNGLITFLIYIMQYDVIVAQLPTHVPSPESEPLDLTPGNIIFYIVVPLIMIIFFFWYRRKRKLED